MAPTIIVHVTFCTVGGGVLNKQANSRPPAGERTLYPLGGCVRLQGVTTWGRAMPQATVDQEFKLLLCVCVNDSICISELVQYWVSLVAPLMHLQGKHIKGYSTTRTVLNGFANIMRTLTQIYIRSPSLYGKPLKCDQPSGLINWLSQGNFNCGWLVFLIPLLLALS